MAARTPLLPDIAHNLTLAMVGSSEAPLLLLDGALTVIAASTSFCRAFHIDPATVTDRSVFDLGAGEWNVPQLRSLLKATSSGQADIKAYEMDLRQAGAEQPRRLLISAHRLEFGGAEDARLLVTVLDVTDARLAEKLKDDLLREKAILLQELQHRVANSLQIIASVLMQSARKVESDETRAHLYDAHNRVMSIATLQKQLAATRLGDVELGPYFDQLCESIGASMIRDHDQLTVKVVCDHSAVPADISISLGLIVTELVINALKHAFPAGRHGVITVGYQSHGPNWTLSVADDGVGMPKDPGSLKAGLGTSIVEALAKQLDARVKVADSAPGTEVSISHSQIAAVEDQPVQAAL
jgi:two-component sensor histidine kinase